MNPSAVSNDIRRDLVALLPRLRRFALTLTGDSGLADALVQDVCARAILKSHQWEGEDRLEGRIFSLIRTGWNEDHRRRSRQDAQPLATTSPSTHSTDMVLSLRHGLASALLLVDVEGFDYTEAASIMGVSPELLSSHLCAARLALSSTPPGAAERRA